LERLSHLWDSSYISPWSPTNGIDKRPRLGYIGATPKKTPDIGKEGIS